MSGASRLAAERAWRLAGQGAHEAAIDAWRDVLTQDPLDARAHAALAHSLFHRRRLAGARAEAARALELDAEQIGAVQVLALCDWFANDRAGALARLDGILALDPLNVPALVLKGQVLSAARRWAPAAAAIEAALRLSPSHRAAWLEAGRIARGRGQGDRAAGIARDLVAADPQDVAALVLLGETCRDAGDGAEAHRLALSALARDAGDRAALDLLAGVKLARNPIGGLFWHIARMLGRLSDRGVLWFAWGAFAAYQLLLTTLAYARVPDPVRDLVVWTYVALMLGLWINRKLIDRMVRRELRTVAIAPDY